MAVEINHDGQIVTVKSAVNSVIAKAKKYSASAKSAIIVGGIPYSGSYEVTPSIDTQVLSTASRMLSQNVVVNPIPSNYGLITYNGSTITVS